MFFVVELVLGLGRQSYVASSATADKEAITQSWARLLCNCGLVVLRAPSLGHPTEVECLRAVVITTGGTVQWVALCSGWHRAAGGTRGAKNLEEETATSCTASSSVSTTC